MPDYSVTIKLSGENPKQIVGYVEQAFGRVVAKQAAIIEWEKLKYFYDPCRADEHFGCVHWTDDDVKCRFDELHVALTPELFDEVKNSIRHIDDGLTELGWEIIEEAIREVTGSRDAR